MFHAEVSNISDKLCCGLMMQFFDPDIVLIYIFIKVIAAIKAGFGNSEDPLSEFR